MLQNIILIGVAVVLLFFLLSMKPKTETDFDPNTGEKITRGIRNKNPGNIKYREKNDWLGKVPIEQNTDKVFEQFTDMKYGARAHLKLLRNIQRLHGKDTVAEIVTHYHPPIDIQLGKNQAKALINYINFVASKMGVRNDQEIDLSNNRTLLDMAYYMAKFENDNSSLITRDLYNQGLALI